jgi:hypothetical protein
MLSKLIEKCDRLLLGESSAANTLVESTEVSKSIGDTCDMITITKVALLAGSNSVTNILQISIGCVKDTANSTTRATTAVDTQAFNKVLVTSLLKA